MFHIREITYAKNCVFACVHKEIDNALFPGANYSFHEIGFANYTTDVYLAQVLALVLTLAPKIATYFL